MTLSLPRTAVLEMTYRCNHTGLFCSYRRTCRMARQVRYSIIHVAAKSYHFATVWITELESLIFSTHAMIAISTSERSIRLTAWTLPH